MQPRPIFLMADTLPDNLYKTCSTVFEQKSLPRIKICGISIVGDKYVNYVLNFYKLITPHLRVNITQHEFANKCVFVIDLLTF